VGGEGGEAFEARLRTALPLSEYLVAHLSTEADASHADGKARFVSLARPLLEKITPGVYRELLLERIAQAIGLSAARLQQWLKRPEGSAPESAPRKAPTGRARAHGRGTLITQAIALLLHYPAASAAVSPEQRQALAQLPHPGVAVLSELLEVQLARPAQSMAQTLERWRERPEYKRLSELAASEPLVGEGMAAGKELMQAIERLLDAQVRGGRLEALIVKAREQSLNEVEKQELQTLTTGHNKVGPV